MVVPWGKGGRTLCGDGAAGDAVGDVAEAGVLVEHLGGCGLLVSAVFEVCR